MNRIVFRSKAALLATSLCFFVTLSGCGQKESAPGTASQKITVGVSLLTRTHPFYQDLEAGLRQAANAAGFELLVTAGEFDVARQKDQIQDFIVRKVNAIVVCPCDS
ncbi:MAG: substrate-binding domain-containing protein, partial [candidate division Zixibacteria bacterium]|nr:substrate-binding domain-containing protein [candidate division Zixibacteria bacterium]